MAEPRTIGQLPPEEREALYDDDARPDFAQADPIWSKGQEPEYIKQAMRDKAARAKEA